MINIGSNSPHQKLDDVAYLCRIPRLFRDGTESARMLVHQSRIRPEEMAVEAVSAILDADPQLVEEWQRWSEDKRTSSGWFLTHEKGSHVVGHLPDGHRLVFADAVSACADFVLKEIQDIWNAPEPLIRVALTR